MLSARRVTAPLRALLAEQVEQTDDYFRQGEPLVRSVPRWLAADVRLFIDAGRAALHAIRRAEFDVWTNGRPRVTRLDRLKLIPQALWVRWGLR